MRVMETRERSGKSHVTEEHFETLRGEAEDLYDKLMEMVGWKVTDNENENDLTLFLFDNVCPTRPSCF
jgi:hypothetical protein